MKHVGALGSLILEIEATHGYLIHHFLSPLSNVRTDGYGCPRRSEGWRPHP